MRIAPLALGFVVVASVASAQDFLGTLNRTGTTFTSRGSTSLPNNNPSYVLQRLDKEDYAGWGVDPANPGMRQILGFHAFVQDQVANTAESMAFLVFTENAAAPNYADVSTPLGSTGPIPIPAATGTGAIPYEVNANFATPVLAPAGGDVFLAIDLPQPAVGLWPTDGMSVHALYYVNVTSSSGQPATTYDIPGASHPTAPPEQQGHGSWYVPSPPTGPIYTLTPRQWRIEPIVPGAAGVAGAITNQTTLPLSNVAPGASSQASGLRPDAQSPPLNSGRADDIAGRWYRTGTPNGTPVFFLLDLGTFGAEIPLTTFLAGSTGVVCLNLLTLQVIGIGFTAANEAFLPMPIPAAARPIVAGVSVLHQSAALLPNGTADANGCTRQVL